MVNVWYFCQGFYRQFMYDHFPFMIRDHIKKQYEERISSANKCFLNGMCYGCGCKTPELFFADKACYLSKIENEEHRELLVGRKDVCYGKMLNKKEYEIFRNKCN